MTEISTNEIMQSFAQEAVAFATQLNKKLDYSPASIPLIEGICSSLHKGIPSNFLARLTRKGPSEEKIVAMSKVLGAYVGEVIRRQFGGNWFAENADNPLKTVALIVGDLKIFPVAKVYNRLKDGEGDDIFKYYFILTKEIGGRRS